MAYQTGTAANQNDLLAQLVVWLNTRGYVTDASQADGAGWRAHLHKGGWYVHLKANPPGGTPWSGYQNNNNHPPELYVYLGTAFSGTGVNWNAQLTGAPLGNGGAHTLGCGLMAPQTSITSYHFFDDENDHIVVVVERSPGLFHQIGWGFSCTRHGGSNASAYIHGQFCGGNVYISSPWTMANSICPMGYCAEDYGNYGATGFIRADVDSFVGKWIGVGTASGETRQGYTGKLGQSSARGMSTGMTANIPHTDRIWTRAVNAIDSRAILLPIRVFATMDAGGFGLIATLPSVYQAIAVGSGYSALQEIQIGTDTYKFFPNFAVKKVA